MLHRKLINPSSIAVIGGSNRLDHIGGSVLKNLIDSHFKGELFVVNPKKKQVQGLRSYENVVQLPQTDLAILAIPASETLKTVNDLIDKKGTRGFIIYAAGFAELNSEGRLLEKELVTAINSVGGNLLGPNNIGMINESFAGIFTRPVPIIDKKGVDFISASGATAVFTIEAAQQIGLKFSSVITVGNSAQLGVEDILQHLDESFVPGKSSTVKMLYLEAVKNAQKFLKHSMSLRAKGCSIVALKSGVTEKGTSAAASHTGAMVNSDLFVQALFDKAGILRCHSRYEMVYLAAVLQKSTLSHRNFAIVTHAGGPAVILTDILTAKGLEVPDLKDQHQLSLKTYLFPGATASNPIDILATGTAEQLQLTMDYCENQVNAVDAIVVIFGSPGLGSVRDAYDVIHKASLTSTKPIFAVMPSVVNVKEEMDRFIKKGNFAFFDESLLGHSLVKAAQIKVPKNSHLRRHSPENSGPTSLISDFPNGYLNPSQTYQLLQSSGIQMAKQIIIDTETDMFKASNQLKFPLAQKVVGPLHKSDKNGVITNVKNEEELVKNYHRLLQIDGADAVLVQEMIKGKEVFIGAKREPGFPPMILCGAGGVYIEVLKDTRYALAPIDKSMAKNMVDALKIAPILQGIRGEKSCHLDSFYEAIEKVSVLMENNPEIVEMDINPLMLNEENAIAVDARIKIKHI